MTGATIEPVSALDVPRRYFHLRDVRWAESGNGKDFTFTGKAAVFNSWSEPLWTPRGVFRERFLPGAFEIPLKRGADVRFLQNHDRNLVLARTKSKTMEVGEDDEALRVWARVARTSYACDLRLAMERGDIDQMSVQFDMDTSQGAQERWYEDKTTGEVLHDVVKVSDLMDVSVVTFPAYVETEAVVRELSRAQKRGLIGSQGNGTGTTGSATYTDNWLPGLRENGDEVDVTAFSQRSATSQGSGGFPADDTDEMSTVQDRTSRKRRYVRCAQVIAETAWAMHLPMLETMLLIVQERMDGNRPTDEQIRERIGTTRDAAPQLVGTTAVVPLVGTVLSRLGAMQEVSAVETIGAFRSAFRTALQDEGVSNIVLDIDSPGGTVDMVPEVAAEIYVARGSKPIIAVANGLAASAAYWLATAADKLVVTPSGEVGSVGVYAAHQDISGMMEQKGIKTTFISAGQYKTEGNAFEPLSEEARGQIQESVDATYQMFVVAVAKYRGVTVDKVEADFGQGRVVTAEKAVELGMADEVATLEQVLGNLSGGVQQRSASYRYASGHHFGVAEVDVSSDFAEVTRMVGAIPNHSTPVVDKPWDGPGAMAACKSERGSLRGLCAWVESSSDPDAKGSYKFPHHEVNGNGTPGSANINGVNNAMARLADSKIPEADKAGVESHLRRHQDDFHSKSESRSALRAYLGLVAPGSSAGDVTDARVTSAVGADQLTALKRASKEAAQAARENKVRLTKEMQQL